MSAASSQRGSEGGGRMTPAQYAAHLGVARQAVMAALARGRLSTASCEFDPERKRWTIDPQRADAEWHANTRQRRNIGVNANAEGAAALGASNDLVAPSSPLEPNFVLGKNDLPVDEDGRPLPPMLVSAWKTSIEAQIKKLELAEREKRLVPAEAAEKSLENVGRLVRDSILAIPARLAHQLAGETDPVQVEILLERVLTEALLALVPPEARP